ncbi:hypothetical protein AE618_12235 [Bosea vaviloviae]|uniref:Methyltransferase n=2 Tax=Bosea vaviloviae TaxID=1526658 RepID=A0A0N0MC71_9HYPH|nr:hypothetical protein AE618_12235 [Bosea vaviloviae]
MAQRSEPLDSLDFFPTPPWATRAFVRHVAPELGILRTDIVWEPACGEGHMAKPLRETFRTVLASDIHPYGYGRVADFLAMQSVDAQNVADLIATNPPFNQAVAFARQALRFAYRGVALLVRTQWLHTIERYELFREFPPFVIAYYVERVPMHRGRWEPEGSTATDYCWVCWKHGAEPRAPLWIPPGQRQALTKPDDAMRFGAPVAAPLFETGA